MTIGSIIELSDLAKAKGRQYPLKRDLFAKLAAPKGRHFTGIVGPRGTGKTVLLQQLAADHPNALYLSADVLEPEDDLFALIQKLSGQFKYILFLLDEIHHLPDASALLKRLYDFLDIQIVFTSSVALAMQASLHDLARRVQVWPLHPFSYREYLQFTAQVELPPLDFPALLERRWLPEHLRAGGRFDDYLRGGNLPFALNEPDPLPLLANIREKIIERDVPTVLRLTMDELEILKRMLRFIGRAAVDGVNYSSLSRNLGITKYKAEQYARTMEQAFVLRQVFPAGTNVLREPKILMAPPYRLLYRDYEDAIGGLREDFCVEALTNAGLTVQYVKSTRGAKIPDYMVEIQGKRVVVEIGGKGKGREQFKGIVADHKVIFAHTDEPDDRQLPLFLLGLVT